MVPYTGNRKLAKSTSTMAKVALILALGARIAWAKVEVEVEVLACGSLIICQLYKVGLELRFLLSTCHTLEIVALCESLGEYLLRFD